MCVCVCVIGLGQERPTYLDKLDRKEHPPDLLAERKNCIIYCTQASSLSCNSCLFITLLSCLQSRRAHETAERRREVRSVFLSLLDAAAYQRFWEVCGAADPRASGTAAFWVCPAARQREGRRQPFPAEVRGQGSVLTLIAGNRKKSC